MASVRCLPRALSQPRSRAQGQEGLEKALFGLAVEQAGAKFRENRKIEPGILEFEGKSILPVNAALYRVGGLPVRKSFDKLHHGDKGQPPGWQGGLPFPGEEVGKLRVGEEGTEFVSHLEIEIAFGKGGTGNTRGFLWHRRDVVGLQGHGRSPGQQM